MKKISVIIGMIAVTGMLYACGGSDSKTKTPSGGIKTTVAAPTISTSKTAVSTPAEAAKTVNASKTLASSFASGSSFPSIGSLVGKPTAAQNANGHRIISTVRNLQQKVTGMVAKQKSLKKQVAAVASEACIDGGSMSVNQSVEPLTITFAACKQYDEYQNGSITMPQSLMNTTSSSTGGTLSLNLTTISYEPGSSYSASAKMNESVMSMTLTVQSFNEATGSSNFSINGTQSQIYYLTATSGTSEKQSFGNFSISMTESTSGSNSITSMTMDGSVSMDTFKDTTFTTIDDASGMAFQNLQLVNDLNSTSGTSSLTINGIYAIKTIPACMDGTFEISTASPIVSSSVGTTSGQMTVNGVAMVFNSDGTITATINSQPQVIDASYATVCSLSF